MGCVGNATPRPLYSRERDPVPIEQGAGWGPGSVWTGAEILAPLLGFDPRSVLPVASRYAECTIPAHIYAHTLLISMYWRLSTAIIKYNIVPESYDCYLQSRLPRKTEFAFLVQTLFSKPQLHSPLHCCAALISTAQM
jgi:hypothetical protein